MIQPIFDAHCQIIDPRFPLTSINGYKPSPFSVNSYLARSQPLGIVGGAVVSGLFQGAKQGYLLEALRRLGSSFVGVAQLPATVTRSEVETLNGFGIRAVRLDLQRGGLEQLEQFETLAIATSVLQGQAGSASRCTTLHASRPVHRHAGPAFRIVPAVPVHRAADRGVPHVCRTH